MDLFSQLIAAVKSDLTISGNSALYNPTAVKLAINRAYRKSGALFLWPETKDAKKTSSIASQEYYTYPDNFRPETIWKLVVDGNTYGDPILYPDFLYEKENDWPSGRTKAWANYGRKYFIYPIPTTNGTSNIEVHGQKVVDELEADADVTIFSYSMPECNDAIVMEAVKILKQKGEGEQSGQFLSAESKAILAVAWQKIRQQQIKYQSTQPEFDIADMFNQSNQRQTRTGNFDVES